MRFKVLAGRHVGLDRNKNEKTWGPGEIADVNEDLCRLNAPGMPPKFMRMDQHVGDDSELHKRADETLQQFAERIKALAEEERAPQIGSKAVQPQAQPRQRSFKDMSLEELQAACADEELAVDGSETKEHLAALLEAI